MSAHKSSSSSSSSGSPKPGAERKTEKPLNYNIVESLGMKFVISCAPSSEDLPRWLELWGREGVRHVVRACEPTYPVEPLNSAGISLHVCYLFSLSLSRYFLDCGLLTPGMRGVRTATGVPGRDDADGRHH